MVSYVAGKKANYIVLMYNTHLPFRLKNLYTNNYGSFTMILLKFFKILAQKTLLGWDWYIMFLGKSHLRIHHKIHTSKWSFTCNICQFSFVHKDHLEWHDKKKCERMIQNFSNDSCSIETDCRVTSILTIPLLHLHIESSCHLFFVYIWYPF